MNHLGLYKVIPSSVWGERGQSMVFVSVFSWKIISVQILLKV